MANRSTRDPFAHIAYLAEQTSTLRFATGIANIFHRHPGPMKQDRFIDAIVAWGDEQAIRDRVRAHYDAGADHVCVQPLSVQGPRELDCTALEALAPAH